jgi:hypothetical protein
LIGTSGHRVSTSRRRIVLTESAKQDRLHPAGLDVHVLPDCQQGLGASVLASQPIGNTWILRGLILSQFNVAGANFAPFCSPFAYIKEQSHTNPTNGW